jgi:hypothetical protein
MGIDPNGSFPFVNKKAVAIYGLGLRFFELIVLILSALATYFHFRESGKRLGDVTQFHLTHTLFSALFWGVNIATALYFSHGSLTADFNAHEKDSWIKDCRLLILLLLLFIYFLPT